MENKKFCKFCGAEIEKDSIICPKCGRQLQIYKKSEEVSRNIQKDNINDDKIYTKAWFMWFMLIFFSPVGIFLMWKFHDEIKNKTKIILTIIFGILFLFIFVIDNGETQYDNSKDNNKSSNKIEVIDFSAMNESEILTWCKDNGLNCDIKREYSDIIGKGEYINQNVKATAKVSDNSKIIITFSLGKEPSTEYKNALKTAERYAKSLHMSKQAIYNQLISEYGEGFESDAAQYAIDNIEWDWNANALSKAKIYRNEMNMSKNAVYDQLISEYGEQFTEEEAQYAIEHLDD